MLLLVRAPFVPRGDGARAFGASLGGRREAVLLLLIVAVALLMRTAGASAGLTAPFWFSETEPLHVAKILQQGTFWKTWRDTLRNVQVGWLHDSPLMLPVVTAVQLLLGPSFALPLFVGALYGVAAVVLAWAVGRAMVSPAFGLLFAAFVAASPLQMVWSRLGGLYVASVPHVLLVLWCGFQAGRRRSLLLALLTGAAIWGSLYYYYAARVAIPLGLLALVAGARRGRASFLRLAVLLLATILVPVGLYWLLHAGTVTSALWPTYLGYVGNKGEKTLAEVYAQNAAPVVNEAQRSLGKYFFFDRAVLDPRQQWFRWPANVGGLCLLPTALFGLIGVAAALRRPGRHGLWLVIALAGLALPALSISTARRFLIFDVAWCALAAAGLLVLLDSRLGRALPDRLRPATAIAIPLAIAAWSFALVLALNASLGGRHGQPLPFGEAGFGDGFTCKRCIEAGRAWQQEIADNAFVVLADNDIQREAPTSPGGLPLYGKLGALAAGRPRNFVELYAAMANWNSQPADAGVMYDSTRTDFASYLVERIEQGQPDHIIWHFEGPTQWERWLAERLVAAGGTLQTFDTPLARTQGIAVRTPWDRRLAAFALLRQLAAPGLGENARCPTLDCGAVMQMQIPPMLLAAPPNDTGSSTTWFVGSWHTGRWGDLPVETLLPAGAAVEMHARAARPRIALLSRAGWRGFIDLTSGARQEVPVLADSAPHGVGCAAKIGDHWWLVDPMLGTLRSTNPQSGWLPQGRWAGITAGPHGELVLATGDQQLVVYDLSTRTEVRRFAALVSPSRRATTAECSSVLAGDGWYATFGNLTSVLSVYDGDGRFVGHRRLDRLLGLGAHGIMAVGANGGAALGVAHDFRVSTLRLNVPAECAGAAIP
jgi:4-amino-4-deoxy-L-arabinose transferase-like glycosyltransferase